MERSRPNVLVTGTPGCGKTSLCAEVASQTGYQHIIVGDWVKEKNLHSGWDDEYQCYILDDDKVGARSDEEMTAAWGLVSWLKRYANAGGRCIRGCDGDRGVYCRSSRLGSIP